MIKQKKGFTMIELLVVIAIIGILSTLAIVSLNSARARARDAKRVSDMKQVQTSLELYFADKNGYPADGTAGAGGVTLGAGNATTLSQNGGFDATVSPAGTLYMGQVPSNATPNGADYVYTSLAASGGAACDTGPCAWYNISFNLEGGAGSLAAGDRNASPTGIQ